MKKVFGQTVRDLKREVNKKVLKVPGVEQKVLDATSNEPWGPHGSLLADIAMATRNYHELQLILSVIWKRLSDTGKNWRHVYKGLAVLEYLVAHGSERVVDEIKEHAYQISMLSDFQYIDSSGRDQGTNVRKKSQSLVALVNDKDRIIEVREKAAVNRDKFRNTPMGGMYRPDSGGYGDKYVYEGRYGSRDEDRSSYGRERDYGYGDDRYGRDGDRYGRDGYRDDDYRGRSRSSDRERAYEDDVQSSARGSGARADDQSQDGSWHERNFSGQNVGAPPSYEEAVSESHSPVHSERIGETSSAPAPGAASPIASDHPRQENFTADNSTSPVKKEGEAIDEFDPRSSTAAAPAIAAPATAAPATAVPAASASAEFDLLGSLSDDPFSSNAMAMVPTLPSTVETNAQANPSAVPSFTSSQSVTNADNQAFDDPFGDGPFRAVTPTQDAIAHEQNSTSVPSFQAPSTNSQFFPQELTSSNQDIDILADILPPSRPSDAAAPQTPFSAPTSQPSQPGPSDQSSQIGSSMFGQPAQPSQNLFGQPEQPGPNMQGNGMYPQPTEPGQSTPCSHPGATPFSQQPQPSGTPYNQLALPGANPYGQQAQPGANPYGQKQAQLGANPYGQQAQLGANPYGQQAQPGANPYGQQSQLGANPYSQQSQPRANPYSQQSQPGANPYGQQAQPGANPYGQQLQPGANPYGQQAQPGANPYGQQQAQPGANGYSQPAQSGANLYGQLGQPNPNSTYGNYNPQPGSIVSFGSNATNPSSGPSAQSSSGGFPTSPHPQSPAGPASPFSGGNFMSQQGSTALISPHNAPQVPNAPSAQQNAVVGNAFSQAGLNSSIAPQSVGSSSAGTLAIVPQASKEKFEPKSTVWADTLSRGLVNLNISGPKTNPLADIGVDFDAINRKEKRMEKTPQTPVTSTITMGKAMGSGTGMGRAGASALRATPNPMVSPGMGMGPNMGMNPGMGMGSNMGMNPGMGMGGYGGMNQQSMGINPGMGMGPNMGMNPGMGMNVGMGQGFHMQPQNGMPPGSTMPGNYNPMMGQGGYPPQQPFGGGYR